MEEKCYFETIVNQHRAPPSFRSWTEDKALISLYFFKVRGIQPNRSMPLSYEQYSQIAQQCVIVDLPRFKRPRNANRYARKFYEVLTTTGVPDVEQPKVVQELFPVLAAAVSTNSIDAAVFDMTVICPRSGDGDGDGGVDVYVPEDVVRPKLIPASNSSIQGLKPVTLDDNTVIKETPECAICLEDFAAAAASVGNITVLPCTHHDHVHCIVQWMEISHLCPLCRHAMPVEDDDHSD